MYLAMVEWNGSCYYEFNDCSIRIIYFECIVRVSKQLRVVGGCVPLRLVAGKPLNHL